MSRFLAIPLVGLFMLAGCNQILTSDAIEYPSMLADFSDRSGQDSISTEYYLLNKRPYVTLSDSVVQVSEEVDVVFYSFGHSHCTEKGGVETEITGVEAELRAYDIYLDVRSCEDMLIYFEHKETLSFSEPGDATITIHGSQIPPGEYVLRDWGSFENEVPLWHGNEEPFSIEKTIEVVE